MAENLNKKSSNSVQQMVEKAQKIVPGTIAISVDTKKRSPAVVLTQESVTITPSNVGVGIKVDDSGVTVQGSVRFTTSGRNITKGIYTENPHSYKPFTYGPIFSDIGDKIEKAYNAAGISGTNLKVVTQYLGKFGRYPLVTDVGGEIEQHFHTISVPHVHALEPAYLYKIPAIVGGFKDAMSSFESFMDGISDFA